MRLGINLAYTRPRYNGRIEALVRNVSVAVRLHQPETGCDNSYPKNVETFKQELGRAIAAHNETPLKNQLRSPRELFLSTAHSLHIEPTYLLEQGSHKTPFRPMPCSTCFLAYAEHKEQAFHLPNFELNA